MPEETLIKVLGLPPAIENILRRKGILTIEELQKMSREQLLSMRTMGAKRMRDIEEALKPYGGLCPKPKIEPIELISERYFQEPVAGELERLRQIARSKQFITYDCFNAIVKGMKVVCSHGHRLGAARDGSVALLSVLRGRTTMSCAGCLERDGEPEG